jgi:beta-glucosidase
MKNIITLLASALSILALGAQEPKFPFNDPDLSIEQRTDDLLGRLTLEEKVGMMMNGSTGVERLGIPDYNWWNEALHGVARAGKATVFPQAIGMAATFDPDEHLRTFTVISDEARAKYNEAIRNGEHKQYYGLSFWTPNINIFRDPRWGRGQETYGEDPFLTSLMGKAAVFGLQGNDDKYYKSHACAKHYAVHSGPESLRHSFDVTVSPRDLWETYLPAFEALVTEADVQEVMGAYNRYAGEPCCSSDLLLMDILRKRWNFHGMVVSDCGAITDFFAENAHETHKDAASASADAAKTGTDVECGSNYKTLLEAVEKGYITEDEIDVNMRRIIKGWLDLGILDYKDHTPWADLPYSIVASKEHAQQALTVARKSMVLLKNENNVLPLKPEKIRKIAVLGPNAADSTMMLGNYNGDPTHVVTILDGIKAAYPDAEVTYERGCDLVEGFISVPKAPRTGMDMAALARQMGLKAIPSENYTDEALKALADRAAQADVIIFAGGISPAVEGEELKTTVDGFAGGDRARIELPEVQSKVLKALHKTGKPVVFVLCTGSAIALEQNEDDYDALLCAWYGGQEGGRAVADVISGKYNPSGRLPLTFYKNTSQLPDFLDYSMDGRTYRYMTESPLYDFGYGLSYTTFEYENAKLSSKKIKNGKSVTLKVEVSNTGDIEGNEPVQVYVKRLDDDKAPVKALKGLKMINLKAGETKTVKIELPASSFEYYDGYSDDLIVKSGEYLVMVGGSSRDADLTPINLTIK